MKIRRRRRRRRKMMTKDKFGDEKDIKEGKL